MKTEKKILIAFVLNLAFSIFEFFGGVFTGSVAILSDAVHDMGDALGIGLSFFFEKKSKKQPDEKYTYGYGRYSVLGSVITTVLLLFGSCAVIYGAVMRIAVPVEINYDGMIVFAIIGVIVNFVAAAFTHGGVSLNQRAVNLHMLEDVLGWLVVLVGALVMRFTDFSLIDPVMSIGVAVFILVSALKNLKIALTVFLEKAPCFAEPGELREHLCALDGVVDVHHIHIWSLDGQKNCATMHVVVCGGAGEIKKKIREKLKEHGIGHAVLELESEKERCESKQCAVESGEDLRCGHRHHH